MKQLFLIFSLLALSTVIRAQPVVYFNFLTHNEETGQWNNSTFYTANRARLMQLADHFSSGGITWNLQSDWTFLTNVLTKETPALKATTANKNILRWLYEERGVEMDPHAHESQYLYPDVVALMDSIGLPESKVIGGTIYNDSNGRNIWTNLVNGQYGRIFTSRFWKPDYMMGGGTPNHVADLKYFGFWNPTSPTNYLSHDPSSPLHHIGVGCEMKIRDTTNVNSFVAGLNDLVQKVQSGAYPSNGIYLQTVFFEQAELNNATFYNKVVAIADSLSAIVSAGRAKWKTLKQTYTEWESVHGSQPFQWACGQTTTTSAGPLSLKAEIDIVPNPAADLVRIKMAGINEAGLRVFDPCGRLVHSGLIPRAGAEVNMRSFPKGLYIFRIHSTEAGVIFRKLILR